MKEQTKMKSDELLKKLADNPFYKMSTQEAQRLEELKSGNVSSSVAEDRKKKVSQTTLGTAVVKETGKLHKHPTDPVSE